IFFDPGPAEWRHRPALYHGAHVDYDGDGSRGAAHRGCAARVSRVHGGAGDGRAQRGLRFWISRLRISPHLWNWPPQPGAVHAQDVAPVHAVAQAPPARSARGAFWAFARRTASRTWRRADGRGAALDFSRDGGADGYHAA